MDAREKARLRSSEWYRNNKEYVKKRQSTDEFRSIARERQKRYRRESKHLTCVYYLPEEHYIGITDNIKPRMLNHGKAGKITKGYEVVAYFERPVDAVLLEAMFHVRGYNGCSYRKDK